LIVFELAAACAGLWIFDTSFLSIQKMCIGLCRKKLAQMIAMMFLEAASFQQRTTFCAVRHYYALSCFDSENYRPQAVAFRQLFSQRSVVLCFYQAWGISPNQPHTH
jgi:hypothetical protein